MQGAIGDSACGRCECFVVKRWEHDVAGCRREGGACESGV
jgi:hypothetical protein